MQGHRAPDLVPPRAVLLAEVVLGQLVPPPPPSPGDGIVPAGGSCDAGGMQIRDNVVSGFAGSGIAIGVASCPGCGTGASEGDLAIVIRDNDFRGNRGVDCVDRADGSGTSGTANSWVNNLGFESRPAGICSRRR